MSGRSSDGFTVDQLEKFLKDHGGIIPQATRDRMMKELIEMKVDAPAPPPDPLIHAIDHAVGNTFNWNTMPVDVQNFGPWSKQYVEGMDAIKIVLEFLQAQEGMDLFSQNRAAKQLYQQIIRHGIERVLMQRGQT